MTDYDGVGPNLAVLDRMETIARAPWSMDEWTHWIMQAWRKSNKLEAAALAWARVKKELGSVEAVDVRVLEILSTPGTASTNHDEWRTRRMTAMSDNNIVELAALTFIQHLFNY